MLLQGHKTGFEVSNNPNDGILIYGLFCLEIAITRLVKPLLRQKMAEISQKAC